MNDEALVVALKSDTGTNLDIGMFDIVGVIDERPVFGSYDGRQVKCARLLWDRADLLVAMEESFSYPGVSSRLVASLECADLAMFLTMARACDRIVSARLTMRLGEAIPR